MKKNIILIAVAASVVSSVLTVLAFRYFTPEKEVILRDKNNAKYVNYTDFMLSGKLQRTFLALGSKNLAVGARS